MLNKIYLKAKRKWLIFVFVISYVKHQLQFAEKCIYLIKFPWLVEVKGLQPANISFKWIKIK